MDPCCQDGNPNYAIGYGLSKWQILDGRTAMSIFNRISGIVVVVIVGIALSAPSLRVSADSASEPARPARAVWSAGGGTPGCPADLNHDGVVDAADLAILLGSWGPCPAITCLDPKTNPTDLNCGASASCEFPDESPIEMDLRDCDCLEGATEEQCCDELRESFEAQCEGYGGILLHFCCGCLP